MLAIVGFLRGTHRVRVVAIDFTSEGIANPDLV